MIKTCGHLLPWAQATPRLVIIIIIMIYLIDVVIIIYLSDIIIMIRTDLEKNQALHRTAIHCTATGRYTPNSTALQYGLW